MKLLTKENLALLRSGLAAHAENIEGSMSFDDNPEVHGQKQQELDDTIILMDNLSNYAYTSLYGNDHS